MRSKFCATCISLESSDDEQKKDDHADVCQKNHDTSSGAMEKDCAKDIWTRSKNTDVHYKYMICDGDS